MRTWGKEKERAGRQRTREEGEAVRGKAQESRKKINRRKEPEGEEERSGGKCREERGEKGERWAQRKP